MPVYIFDAETDGVPLPLIARRARLIVWPGSGATYASLNRVELDAGEANVPHTHAESEDTIFVIEGQGTVRDFDHDLVLPVHAGCVIHVPEGVRHAVTAETRMVSVGGPCPPDLTMLRATGVLK
ncbi:MAG: cupin domain-containing protein [Armatimonadota bacterium]|nr:cupin domain-containing protein [Armatimonadota bacterium]